ncbi:MAG: glycosyl hydrolase family 17 protein [Vitreoscilla sp.]
MNHRDTLLARAALASALVFSLAACGGDDGGSTAPPPPAPAPVPAARKLPSDYATRKAVAYSPFRSGNRDTETITADEVLQDLQLLKQANFGLIRLFDSSDAVAKLTLKVIKDNNLDIKVHLGAYVIAGNDAFNTAEIARAIQLATDYPGIVEAVSVGNETMVNWSFNKFTPAQIEAFLATVRAGITQPVTTDDNWALWAAAPDDLLKAVDFVALHTYSLLDTVSAPGQWDWQQAGVPADQRAAAMMDASIAKAKSDYAAARTHLDGLGYTTMPIVIGETGWKATPTGGETQRAHPVNQKMYVDRLAAWKAAATGAPLNIVYFEAFDEPWKGGDDGWGLFNVARQARYVVQGLVPPSGWEAGAYTDADALHYVAPVVTGPVTASRYTLYSEQVDAGEAFPSAPLTWDAWQNGQTSNEAEDATTAAEGGKSIRITPTPLDWGWGMTLNFRNGSENLTNFQAAGTLNFSIKTTYAGKIEVGFLTGTAGNSSLYDVYIPLASGQYGYVNDGNWHDVHIPIADITPHGAMAFGMTDPTRARLDLSTVTNPFVINDTYGVTGNTAGSTTPISVDNIYWSNSPSSAPATLTFSSGFADGGRTVEGGAYGGYSGSDIDNWNCGAPAQCGNGGTTTSTATADQTGFYHYYQTLTPATGEYVGIFLQAPGLATGISGSADTPGLQLADQTTMRFTFGMNPEWWASPTKNVGVLLTLGKSYAGSCNIKLVSIFTPTAQAATAYSLPLASFSFNKDCGSGLTVAQALAQQPIAQIDFQGDGGSAAIAVGGTSTGANLSVATTGTPPLYPTTLVVDGGVTFQ